MQDGLRSLKIGAAPRRKGVPVQTLAHISLFVMLLIVFTTPFIQMTGQIGESFKIYRVFGYALVVLLQFILAIGRGGRKSLEIFATPVVGIIIWLLLSLMWAEHLDLSGKRILILLIVYVGIFSGVCDLGQQRFLAILRIFLAAVLVINFAFVFAFPDIGVHDGQGQWRGFLANKNIAGIVCATTVLFFTFDCKIVPITLRLAIISAALFFLYQSWSRTPLIILPIACMAGWAVMFIKLSPNHAGHQQNFLAKAIILFFCAILLAFVILTIQRDLLISLTDNIGALSLRNAIWRPMLLFYLDHPLLGAGYGSYWDAGLRHADIQAFNSQKWLSTVDQGHNGYLDILVQAGLPGLMLALSATLLWPMLRFIVMLPRYPAKVSLIFSVLVMLTLENFTESSMFFGDVFGNAILLSVLAMVHRFDLKSKKPRHGTV